MTNLEAQILKATICTDTILFKQTAISTSGDVYVTGTFTGTLDIRGGVAPITTISNDGCGFIAKYNSNLTPTLLKSINTNPKTDEISDGLSIAISTSGDVYVTGKFTGTLDIGGGVPSITSISNDGCGFIAKYNSNLTPTLLKSINTNPKTDEISIGVSIAISTSGDVYVTGTFGGTLDIGGGVPSITTISNDGCGFIAKYNSNLTPTLLKSINTNPKTDEISDGLSIAISTSGDVYVTGTFGGTLDIGDGVPPITNINSISTFIAKYTSNLTPSILKYVGSTTLFFETILNCKLVLSSSGDVYVIGYFKGTLDIGGGVPPITNINSINTFIAKYNSNLTPTLLKSINTNPKTDEISIGVSIAISTSGDVYVTGTFTGTLDIGGGVPPTSISNDGCGFIAKYNSNLTPTLLKSINTKPKSDELSIGFSIAISTSGDVYVTGTFGGTLDIGDGVPPINYANGFIAKYLITDSTTTTTHHEPICLVSGTPILTDQGIVPIDKIDTSIHTIGNQRIVAVTKSITPEKNLICFEKNSMAINCPTKRTIMTPGHEVLYKGKLVQAKHFVGKLDGVHTVPYDGKVVYNVLLEKHGLMSVNNMVVETLNPTNKVAKSILNAL